MKKLFLLFILFIVMFSSTFAVPTANFFSQTPTLTSFDTNTGVGQVYFDVGSDDDNLITANVELMHSVAGVVDSLEVINLASRNSVTYNFDLSTLGNYNGDYTIRVTLIDEDISTNQEVNEDVTFSFSNGVAYAPQEASSISSLSDLIILLFGVIAVLIAEIVTLFVGDFLVLAVVGAVLSLIIGVIYALITYVKAQMNSSVKMKK